MKVLEFKKPANDTDNFDQTITGPVRCFGCRHEWQGLYHAGTTELECPACGTMKGLPVGICVPASENVYTCPCGNDLFIITEKRGPLCVNCGLYHRPYDNPRGAA